MHLVVNCVTTAMTSFGMYVTRTTRTYRSISNRSVRLNTDTGVFLGITGKLRPFPHGLGKNYSFVAKIKHPQLLRKSRKFDANKKSVFFSFVRDCHPCLVAHAMRR